MAGTEVKQNHVLRASTILEVLVSLIVFVVVFSIAMGIFANVQRLSLSAKKLRAQAVLKEWLLKAAQHPEVSKQTIEDKGFTIEKNITNYRDNATLYRISLAAYDGKGEKIAELNQIAYEGK